MGISWNARLSGANRISGRRSRRQVGRGHRYVLGGGAVAIESDEPVHLIPGLEFAHTGCDITDDAGHFVRRDDRSSAGAVAGPRLLPRQLVESDAPAARTATSTSPSAGTGTGAGSMTRTSGPPRW